MNETNSNRPRSSDVSIGHSERAAQDTSDPRAEREQEQAERDARLEDAIAGAETLEEKVIASVREVYDPEIPVNIYDLGLIYHVEVGEPDDETGRPPVHVVMTLTSPACPVAEQLPGEVRAAVERVPEVGKASVELTFDPPWSMEKMSEEAKLMLGFM